MLKRPRPTAEEIPALAREAGVRYVRMMFADVLGRSKNVVVPISEIDRALSGKVTFDGGSIDGFVRDQEIDMILRPDPGTYALLPAQAGEPLEARLICDIAMPDGDTFEGCPRTTLRRIADDASTIMTELMTSVEVEFYLFDGPCEGIPRTSDAGSYFDFAVGDRGETIRTAIVLALEEMGIPVASSHHEHGSGQHEIELRESSIIDAADHLMTLRTVAKTIAARHGMHATFMPKPDEASAGSGLHMYFSWSDDATQAQRRPVAEPQLAVAGHFSQMLRDETGLDDGAADRYARDEELDKDAQELQSVLHDLHSAPDEMLFGVGGLLAHAPACTAICNPTVNSYKRLVGAWDAPIYTVWSHRSANALVRVPTESDRRRLEMRSPDPSCNPYLALAVLLASIVDGLRDRLLPGAPLTETTYDLDERTRLERGIRTLPKSLREAIGQLDEDMVVRNALGDHIYHAFRDAKVREYESYRRAVHPWERDRYLKMY